MKSVFLVFNDLSEADVFQDYIETYLSDVRVDMGTQMPPVDSDYDIINIINYTQLVKNISAYPTAVVMHSTDLPKGKGWAPIAHSILNEEEWFTMTAFRPNEKVDAGPILAKLRFKLHAHYTADLIRKYDNEMMIRLTRDLVQRVDLRTVTGVAHSYFEDLEETYHPRITPDKRKLDLSAPLGEVLKKIRAFENRHPAFVEVDGRKVFLTARPEEASQDLPEDLECECFFTPINAESHKHSSYLDVVGKQP